MKQKTDEQIKKEIIDLLYWDSRINASDIKVEVHEGIVTLTGKVPNFTSKSIAEIDVIRIIGVKNINNNITINFPVELNIPTDIEIEEILSNNIKWTSSINSDEIKIEVENGTVVLSGSVDSYWKKELVNQFASNTVGVLEVINKIVIIPTEKLIDEAIAEKIIDRISKVMGVDVNNLDVTVKNGDVILKGTVPFSNQYYNIEEIAYHTSGVKDVSNNLIIEG